MKLSDYLAKYFEQKNVKHIFGVTGGGAMHLNDSFGKSKKIKFVMHHHEQAATMAAEAYSRLKKSVGVVSVTTGPGGTNSITGVAGAWLDSIPLIIISGQVAKKYMINKSRTRQIGVQEINIIDIVKPITKNALTLKDPNKIKYELDKAFYLANHGRPGPVWIDVPLDIQNKKIDIKDLKKYRFTPKILKEKKINEKIFKRIIYFLNKSKRPVLVAGNGIHTSSSEIIFKKIVKYLKIPVLTSWNAKDLLENKDDKFIGSFGLFGDRASNFAVQNSDCLFVIGSRLSQPQTGYHLNKFSTKSKMIFVDQDKNEIKKFGKKIYLPINHDINIFFNKFYQFLYKKKIKLNDKNYWSKQCLYWKKKYPVFLSKYKKTKKINSFFFIDVLSKILGKNLTIVTDMGTSFTCTMQSFKCKKNQRLFTSSGLASMGYGIPGSIGASFANNKKNKIICISGDGGAMFNIQELQTIVHHQLPIKIFILNNEGYLTMKLMQKKNFKYYVGSNRESGISCPNFVKLAKSFGLKSMLLNNGKKIESKIRKFLLSNKPGLCQIDMPSEQELIPRVQTKVSKKGQFLPTDLEDMYPYLDRKEYFQNILFDKE
jgi:acetolactate synthase-1/2/3 large subunit